MQTSVPSTSAGRISRNAEMPVARRTTISLSVDSRLATCTVAAKAASGSTMNIRKGITSSENSMKTATDWPSPISRSNSDTARFTQ